MYKFIKTIDDSNPHDKSEVIVTIPFNDITIDDLCEHFEYFLKGCGFFIDNTELQFVDKESNDNSAPDLSDDDFIPDTFDGELN